jgi:hypothetical protein
MAACYGILILVTILVPFRIDERLNQRSSEP